MTITRGSVVRLIQAAARTDHDLDTVARVAWATVSPPGDEVVGALIGDMGASTALEMVFGEDQRPVGDLTIRRVRRRVDALSSGRVAFVLRTSERQSLTILTPLDHGWPRRLDRLGASSPVALWVRGRVSLLRRPNAAVIGDARLSPAGLHATLELASQLAVRGYVVVSAGTPGVDTAALLATVAVRQAPMAVLDTGIDEDGLGDDRRLADRVMQAGALVTEVPPGAPPDEVRSARHSRLLAAITDRTIVVEASAHSEALVTARFARDLGSRVGAVPGRVDVVGGDGCALLLEYEGAAPVATADDVAWM
jgi:DNA processing protein